MMLGMVLDGIMRVGEVGGLGVFGGFCQVWINIVILVLNAFCGEKNV